jgi:hypothetical protein
MSRRWLLRKGDGRICLRCAGYRLQANQRREVQTAKESVPGILQSGCVDLDLLADRRTSSADVWTPVQVGAVEKGKGRWFGRLV